MEFPGTWELVLILLVIVVVFGSKRLPDSARALGRSMRILKAETKGLHDDDATTTTTAHVGVPLAAPLPSQPPAPAQPVAQVQPNAPVQMVQPVVEAQPFAGQQLFDAQGRPVQLPAAGSQQVQQAPSAQA